MLLLGLTIFGIVLMPVLGFVINAVVFVIGYFIVAPLMILGMILYNVVGDYWEKLKHKRQYCIQKRID